MQPPPYRELLERWRRLAALGAIELDETTIGRPERLMQSARIAPANPERVLLAAGVHGDEPVTSWALLDIVESGLLDTRYGFDILCCTNPTGYEAGTRRNAEWVDINRGYVQPSPSIEAELVMSRHQASHYRLVIDLHEDFEAEGMYLYEPVVDGTAPLGRRILEALEGAGYPLQVFSAAFDLGYLDTCTDEVRRLEPGRVLPNIAQECAHFADGLPLTMFFLHHGLAERSLTIESPRSFAWHDRMAIHRIAVVEALMGLSALTG